MGKKHHFKILHENHIEQTPNRQQIARSPTSRRQSWHEQSGAAFIRPFLELFSNKAKKRPSTNPLFSNVRFIVVSKKTCMKIKK